ncbi:tRNA (guanine-N(7)-)-methyltransferase [Roseivivax halodurans JCM 10272]|uniref:tRNA (guanine-N(7)-)-methyltransferase n=1 Tax=Roseivivax halodurans JCM 10272 TaxID=1449350 RepID=X7EDQ5_9RHOB|nr:tRNA (guanine(46)-N(7))-methyltransferase TrmB [Roseivivax halodurans]ETX13995.1 tRNA (guanine-N(7)-)-methyltransferase [Roseivivax halodurans JCM 10272]
MTRDTHPSGAPWRNFYGRLKGHALRPAQERYLDEDLPQLRVENVGWDENPDRDPIDPASLFGGKPVVLEIGFGGGEHLVEMAGRFPDHGFIGCEPYINGVAMMLGKLRESGASNVRVHPGDVRDLFDVLPAGSLAGAYLLYPDPWPKKRHHRRRFVTPEHLRPLHAAIIPGALLRVATDIPDYVRQTMEEVPRAGFEWLAEGPRDWREPWAGWPSTRYERKALREGRVPHYMEFRRT